MSDSPRGATTKPSVDRTPAWWIRARSAASPDAVPDPSKTNRTRYAAGLEDHFCGKLLGLPLGIDVCYTNHAEADQDDMDNLLTLLAAAGVTFIMGVPGADDVMLNYQSTSFHDALYVRDLFGLKRAPEFDDWLVQTGIADAIFRLAGDAGLLPDFASRLIA